MLTLFTVPRAFDGEFGLIQRNALRSWTLLESGSEVIVIGDEAGTAEVARDFGLRHVIEVRRNVFGTPLVDDVFRRGEEAATHDVLAYVNADIILGPDFVQAVRTVFAGSRRDVLMIGRRVDLEIDQQLGSDPGWWERLSVRSRNEGHLHDVTGIDYFVYRRGMWGEIPPFALGRTMWDNWLVYRAGRVGARVVDATEAVLAIHQNHDYGHHPEGRAGVWSGPEAVRNRALAGDPAHLHTIDNATHEIDGGRVRSRLSLFRLYRLAETTAATRPLLAPFARLLLVGLRLSYPVRRRLGLTGSNRRGGSEDAL